MSKDFDTSRAIEAWLLQDAFKMEMSAIVEGLGARLTAAGLPIDRLSISFGLLNPSILAAAVRWRPGRPTEWTRYEYSERDQGLYERSPFKVAHEEGRWVDLHIPSTPDETYGIVPALREEGIVNYIAIPMTSASPEGGVLTLTTATKSEAGYTEDQRGIIAHILPALGAVVELRTLSSTFRNVLSAYVGSAPAREILTGTVHRGEVTSIRAAILIADLRGFTNISTKLPPEKTATLINEYYDAVVPPIVARGGEVLKFIGDAVLAIFPVHAGEEDCRAVHAALDAARAALLKNHTPFKVNGHSIPIHFGIAIHVGDAVLGNVGSSDRLDFTVIGRDVNTAARLASLCSNLGRDFLVSEAVAEIGLADGQMMEPAGAYEVRGMDEPITTFVPDTLPGKLPPQCDDGVSQGLTLVD